MGAVYRAARLLKCLILTRKRVRSQGVTIIARSCMTNGTMPGGIRTMAIRLLALLVVSSSASAADRPDFERDVAPILVQNCLECHYAAKPSGGLNMATEASLQKGGDSGAVIVPGKPDQSFLLDRIVQGEMPPPEHGKPRPLSTTAVNVLKTWIEAGAPWPKARELGLHEKAIDLDQARTFWSFQPVRRPAVPDVQHQDRVANPIDRFIWKRLESAGIEMASPATPPTLLRRLALDLTGLPPTLAEQDRFLGDASPSAHAVLVDRLLASPAYGERWARHWLDLVRYADSNGYERDAAKPGVWRYRDYVIDSLNADKPYDRFVLEQLAGDELSDANIDTVIATGFHALGTWQDEVDPLEAAQYRADELDDMLRTTAQTFLGLTIGCARCHNHKFDPLSMLDYYSLSAILAPLGRPNSGRTDRDLPAATPPQRAALLLRDTAVAGHERRIEQLREPVQQAWLLSGDSKLPPEAIAAYRKPAAERSTDQQALIKKHADALREEVTAALPEETRLAIAAEQTQIDRLRAETPDLLRGYFLVEASPTAPPAYLLLSGRAANRGPLMQPRVPAVLAPRQPEFESPDAFTSRRRLSLARWIASPGNPLTARVIVNRVWQHHFGEGLVRTPSDFGNKGDRPSHPELLDWLSDWFVHDAGWSLKRLHRLIVTSETYRMNGDWNAVHAASDPENRLLWRYPVRRLEIEAIRDSMLAVSGKLNRAMRGPAVSLPIAEAVVDAHTDKQAAWKASPEPDIFRRTVYAFTKRTLLVPMLEVLDLCDTTQSTDRRSITSIAPQALTLFNGDFVNQQAAYFAQRLLDEAGSEAEQQVQLAFRLALGRPPRDSEAAQLVTFLRDEASRLRLDDPALAEPAARQQALTQLCRVLFNLNEFLYPD